MLCTTLATTHGTITVPAITAISLFPILRIEMPRIGQCEHAKKALEPTGRRFLTAAIPPHQLRRRVFVHTQPNTITRCTRAFRAQRNEDPGRNDHAQNLENIDLNVVHTGDTSTRTSETPMLFNAKVVPPVNPSLKEILSATGFRSTQKQSTLSRTLEQMIHRSL